MSFNRSQREAAFRQGNLTTLEKLLGGFPLEERDFIFIATGVNSAIKNSNWDRVDNLLKISSEYKIPLKIYKDSYEHLAREGKVDLIERLLRIDPPKPGSNEEKDLFKYMIEEAIKLEKWDDAFILFNLGKQSHGRIEMIVYACATNNIPMFIELINLYSLETMLRYPLSVRMKFVHRRIGKYASKDMIKILLYKYDIPKLDELETNVKIVRTSKQNEKGYMLADVNSNGELLGQLAIYPQPPMEKRVDILWELLMEFVRRSDEDAKDLVAFFCDKLNYLLESGNWGVVEVIYAIYDSDNLQYFKDIIKFEYAKEFLLVSHIVTVMRVFEENEIIELLKYNPRVRIDRLIRESVEKGYIKLLFYVIKDYEKYMYVDPNIPVQVQRKYISDINLLLSLLIRKNVISWLNREQLEYFEQLVKLIKEKYLNLDVIKTRSPEQEELFREFSTLLNDLFYMIRDYRPDPDDNMRRDARERLLYILGQ